jgi:heme oxygenase (biliverdin-producing, ferredoxin)
MTTTGSPPSSGTFSELLRARTQADHARAETSGYMAALLDGQLSRERYAELVAQLSFVYDVLESAAETMRDDPVAGPFVADELRRGPALDADLEALLGEDWADQIAPSSATRQYCDRLREVCFTWPGGFVAHHYTRYLGDLSGGQVIGAIVRRVYEMPRARGAAFYEFPLIDDKNAFKTGYRRRLDEAPWNLEEQEQVVEEIVRAYAFNVAMLAELDGVEAGTPGS